MTKELKRDSLYAKPLKGIEDFIFDEQVAEVFDDMIKRSVPGYHTIIQMIGCLTQQHVKEPSHCYDLGCSLGTVTFMMRNNIRQKDCRIIAVDNSQAMMDKCKENVCEDSSMVPVDFVCDDIQNILITKGSMVVLNFTLQFIDLDKRDALIQKIYDGMIEGGILIISEKIAFENKKDQAYQEEMYRTFKRLNGYSDLEIAQKRTALENVLIPDTLEGHRSRLKAAGFEHVHVWFQCFNFASIVAFK